MRVLPRELFLFHCIDRPAELTLDHQPLLFVSSTINFVVLPVVAITLELLSAYSVAVSLKAFEAMRRFFLRHGLTNPLNEAKDLSDS